MANDLSVLAPARASAPAASAASAASAPASSASTAEPGLPLIRSAEGDSPYNSLVPSVLTVVLVGAALIWGLRRGGFGKLRTTPPSSRMLTIRETVHVAPKVRVTYLRCGDHELLLAHSEHSQAWLSLSAPTSTPPADPPAPFNVP